MNDANRDYLRFLPDRFKSQNSPKKSPCGSPNTVRAGFRRWYKTGLGRSLAKEEIAHVSAELPQLFGYHLIQIGTGTPSLSLEGSYVRHQVVTDSDLFARELGASLQCDPSNLPIASDSVDLVILSHVLELDGDPHQVLREVGRVLVPEGHVLVLSFNPWSLWGLKRLFSFGGSKKMPWCARFIRPTRVKDWLQVLGFEIINVKTFYHRPAFRNPRLVSKMDFIDRIGQRLWPAFGAVSLFVARKRVVTGTPIGPRWRRRGKILAPGLVETRQWRKK